MAERRDDKTAAVERAEKRAELQSRTLEAVGSLTEAVETNTAEVVMLRHDVNATSEARTWKNRLLWFATAVATGLLAATPFAVYSVVSNRHTVDGLQRSTQVVVDCTKAGNPQAKKLEDRVHACFDASIANQNAAVQRIIDANNNGVLDSVEILQRLGATPTTTTIVKH